MVPILKIIGVISCGVVLCLSLSNATEARHRMEPAPCDDRFVKCNAETQEGIRTITGEVLHINGARLLVKQSDGEEVILHIDLSTQMSGHIGPGSRIEAKVNEVEREKYVVSISQAR
jgi:hypothetical protein